MIKILDRAIYSSRLQPYFWYNNKSTLVYGVQNFYLVSKGFHSIFINLGVIGALYTVVGENYCARKRPIVEAKGGIVWLLKDVTDMLYYVFRPPFFFTVMREA